MIRLLLGVTTSDGSNSLQSLRALSAQVTASAPNLAQIGLKGSFRDFLKGVISPKPAGVTVQASPQASAYESKPVGRIIQADGDSTSMPTRKSNIQSP